jgi:hypothetical protein
MADAELQASWERAKERLEEARVSLSEPDAAGTRDYADYLGRNELGLAFDVLVEVGVEQHAERPFWRAIRSAASGMHLTKQDGVNARSMATIEEWLTRADRYPCPCCGHLVFREPPGSYDICPVCFWEDDSIQLRWPEWAGGANKPSLIESQRNYLSLGAMEQRFVANVRAATNDELIEDGWRTIDPALDNFEPRGVNEAPWPEDLTALYWWRRTFWRCRTDSA